MNENWRPEGSRTMTLLSRIEVIEQRQLDLEIVFESCLRRGLSREAAFEVVESCILECRGGDTTLLEFLRAKALH